MIVQIANNSKISLVVWFDILYCLHGMLLEQAEEKEEENVYWSPSGKICTIRAPKKITLKENQEWYCIFPPKKQKQIEIVALNRSV